MNRRYILIKKQLLTPYDQALKALETGCGNCQEIAYAGALLLRAGGFTGKIQIAEFGINHVFLIVDDYIVDTWSDTYFPFSTWKTSLKAYGGSIKKGVMRGWILSADHFELEDEEPEVTQSIPTSLDECLPLKKHLLKEIIQEKFSNEPEHRTKEDPYLNLKV